MIRNIYLIDDDDAVRASLHGLLSLRSDLVVRNFRSGDQFLERAPDLESGVLLLDYHMPGKNGLEVLEQLGSFSHARFPAIILTGEGNIDVAVQAMVAHGVRRLAAYDPGHDVVALRERARWLVELGSNENPYGPSPAAAAARQGPQARKPA